MLIFKNLRINIEYKGRKMKHVKRICSVLLALVMMITIIPLEANAATKDSIPTKVRLFSGVDESAISIELADETQSISNIKTSNKNLVAMLTRSDYRFEKDGDVVSNSENKYAIGLRSKKDGKYTVSFDIIDKDKKKIATKKVTVFAYPTPLKSITMDGKQLKSNQLTGKSAKVKVTLTSGNTIKKLEYGVYQTTKKDNSTSSEIVYKTFKNNSKITFGTKAYTYSSDYSSEYSDSVYVSKYFNTGMSCPTYIRITYYDKYTKRNETFSEYFSKVIE